VNSNLPIVEVWSDRDRSTISDWVKRVSDIFANSQSSVIATARVLKVHPAELFAVLNLATLEDELLEKISESSPPITTWLSLSKADAKGIEAGLQALESAKKEKNKTSPCQLVDDAIERVGGGGPTSRVAKLESNVIIHAAKKAEEYGALTPKSRAALKKFGSMRKTGKLLTPKQIGYMQGMLEDLVKRGVIKRNSQDGDQEFCNQILDALGSS
jgi:hypothetical protein